MRTYLITYDLAGPARHGLAGAIMQLGEAWARPLETTWYVQSPERPDALERRLRDHLDGEDGLLIQQVEANAVLLNTALRWFKRRRQPDGPAALGTNILAFPRRETPEAKAA
jgi:hypothetical protein